MDTLAAQLHGISKGLKCGDFNILDLGNTVPTSLMIHDVEDQKTTSCSYMNDWGCDKLGSFLEEIKEFGEVYYFERYFVKEESFTIFQNMNNCLAIGG